MEPSPPSSSLLDAEAGAKEFNKNILSTAGSSEFLHKNMKNTVAAGEDLEDMLNKIRGQATSLDNLDWGINKETHTAVLNAITAEGKSLKSLQADFDRTGKAAEGAAGYAKDWGFMVQMSVAYSRAFGVSLQEVSQLEGEMMTDLGMNLTDVEKQFQYMTVGAEEAGIATNKFFNIIRSFSADLTLFTIRMEDITKVMMALGKAMSPRDAQKFLQGITGFFKGQGLAERTKAVIMGGGAAATNARLQKSMDQKLGTLASDIADATGSPMQVKDLKKVLKKSDKELANWLATDGEKLSDDQKKAIREAAIQQQKLLTNNPVDTASALADIDPFDTMEQLEAQSMGLFGKKFDQLTGVQRLGAESAIGVSDEQQKGFRKLNMGVEQMQADLAHKLDKGMDLTDAEKDALKHLGVDATAADAGQQIRDKKAKEVWNAMSADQKSLLENGKQEIDYQKETSKYQTSAIDKLGILVDFVMNQIYTIMSDTYDAILDLYDAIKHPLGGSDTKSRKDMAKDTKAVQKSGNMELIRAWGKSQGDLAGVRAELQKGSFGKFGQMADKQVQKLDELQKKLDDPKTPDDQKELIKQQIMFAKLHLDEAKRQTILNISSDDQLKVASDTLSAQDFAKLQKTIAAQGGKFGDITEVMKTAGITLDPKTLAAMEKGSMKYMNLEGIQSTLDQLPKLMESMNPPDTQIGKLAPNIGNAMDTIVSPNSVHVDVNDPEKIGAGAMGMTTPADDNHEESQDTMEEQSGTLQDIYKALRVRGIKLDKPFVNSTLKTVIKDATYDAASDALYEYALSTNWKAVEKWAKTADEQGQKIMSLKDIRPAAQTYYGEGGAGETYSPGLEIPKRRTGVRDGRGLWSLVRLQARSSSPPSPANTSRLAVVGRSSRSCSIRRTPDPSCRDAERRSRRQTMAGEALIHAAHPVSQLGLRGQPDADASSPMYRHPARDPIRRDPDGVPDHQPARQPDGAPPHALVMHVNPSNFNESYTKKIERIQTRGGFVEQHWGDELSRNLLRRVDERLREPLHGHLVGPAPADDRVGPLPRPSRSLSQQRRRLRPLRQHRPQGQRHAHVRQGVLHRVLLDVQQRGDGRLAVHVHALVGVQGRAGAHAAPRRRSDNTGVGATGAPKSVGVYPPFQGNEPARQTLVRPESRTSPVRRLPFNSQPASVQAPFGGGGAPTNG